MGAEPHILIVGAGPTGLGAAWRLQELGRHNWTLIDAAETAGGLASSVVDPQGFTWDLGGHVLFSHYTYFDRLMDDHLGYGQVEHVRESWVWMRERFIPYPLQHNIWRLPPEDLMRACMACWRSTVPGPPAVKSDELSRVDSRSVRPGVSRSIHAPLQPQSLVPILRPVACWAPPTDG